jgi:hypothetical protein
MSSNFISLFSYLSVFILNLQTFSCSYSMGTIYFSSYVIPPSLKAFLPPSSVMYQAPFLLYGRRGTFCFNFHFLLVLFVIVIVIVIIIIIIIIIIIVYEFFFMMSRNVLTDFLFLFLFNDVGGRL